MIFEAGQLVRVEIPEIVCKTTGEVFPAESFEGVVRAANVPCSVALGLMGIEVTGPDGMVYHLDEKWVNPVL